MIADAGDGRHFGEVALLARRELTTIATLALMLIGFVALPLLHVDPAWYAVGALALAIGGGGLTRDLFRRAIDWGFLVQFGILLGAGGVLHAHGVDAWIAGRLLALIGGGWHPAQLVLLLTAVVFACRLLVPWIPATLLPSLALVPAAPGSVSTHGWWGSWSWWPPTRGSSRPER